MPDKIGEAIEVCGARIVPTLRLVMPDKIGTKSVGHRLSASKEKGNMAKKTKIRTEEELKALSETHRVWLRGEAVRDRKRTVRQIQRLRDRSTNEFAQLRAAEALLKYYNLVDPVEQIQQTAQAPVTINNYLNILGSSPIGKALITYANALPLPSPPDTEPEIVSDGEHLPLKPK